MMKLNHDCVRKILLFFEGNLKSSSSGLPEGLKIKNVIGNEYLSEFDQQDIYYALSKLVEAGFLKSRNNNVAPKVMIIDEITWVGHDYLNSIRDSKVWSEVKNRTKDLSSVALSIVKNIAIEATKQFVGL